MDMISCTSEIVEAMDDKAKASSLPKMGSGYSIEDDINRLFEAIHVSSVKGVGLSNDRGKEILQKRASKRPMRAGSSQSTGIGISEPVSLKQALRGLCISQASELAAMKRLPKQGGCSGSSEAGTVKRLYRSVVVEANGSGLPLNDDGGNLVEISLVPERIGSVSPDSCQSPHLDKAESSNQGAHNSKDHMMRSDARLKGMDSAVVCCDDPRVNEGEKITSVAIEVSEEASTPENQKNYLDTASSLSNTRPSSLVRAFPSNSPSFIKPIFRMKNFSRKKVKQDSSTTSSSCTTCNEEVENSRKPGSFDSGSRASNPGVGSILEAHQSSDVNSSNPDTSLSSASPSSTIIGIARSMFAKIDERPTVKDKGDFSQSSNSSIGEYSCSTSEASSSNGSSCCGNRPHMSRDLRWEAINQIKKQHGYFSLKHFKLVKKLGCGDIGSVFLAELSGTNCLFALKVMDDESLANRKKTSRAQTEKDILQMLDHPFLPTLYGHFVSDKLSCLVMEYCPGGDLHMLRQKQPGRSFSEQAVRFYAAEVLLAIEYLHMLGIVYRDLKPENVLVREDGHIMLSDFDLSLRCSVNPVVVQSSSPAMETTGKASVPCSESICIQPFCLHPAWQVSCFGPKLLSVTSRSRKLKSDLAAQMIPLPQLVAEPTGARSNSFVGTYEYLAPEIVKTEGHGSAVDWWMFGIFLFELLYGKTPFKGSGNDETLSNVVSRSLKFPSSPIVSLHARDLIRGLLVKEPENRLGSGKGAAEIKQHSFFDGLNWALIRCAVPPELPKPSDTGMGAPTTFSLKKDSAKCQEFSGTADNTEFEMF